MTRYTLTVPTHDNDGNDLSALHATVRENLAETHGGFTELSGTGYWGGEHSGHEPVRVYIIDSAGPLARMYLRETALYVKTRAAQDAVYLTAQPIETELV